MDEVECASMRLCGYAVMRLCGYAVGLYGEISRVPQMLIVFAIVAIQIPLSSWWLKYYQFSQLEWSWRSLTYQKRQSFRVIPS